MTPSAATWQIGNETKCLLYITHKLPKLSLGLRVGLRHNVVIVLLYNISKVRTDPSLLSGFTTLTFSLIALKIETKGCAVIYSWSVSWTANLGCQSRDQALNPHTSQKSGSRFLLHLRRLANSAMMNKLIALLSVVRQDGEGEDWSPAFMCRC